MSIAEDLFAKSTASPVLSAVAEVIPQPLNSFLRLSEWLSAKQRRRRKRKKSKKLPGRSHRTKPAAKPTLPQLRMQLLLRPEIPRPSCSAVGARPSCSKLGLQREIRSACMVSPGFYLCALMLPIATSSELSVLIT